MLVGVEEVIEQMIEEKLGLYEPKDKGRRTANELRDQMQYELSKRPMNTHELADAINTKRSTIEKHCSHLQNLDVVRKVEVDGTEYWKLKSRYCGCYR